MLKDKINNISDLSDRENTEVIYCKKSSKVI